jgi:hypothetical protein
MKTPMYHISRFLGSRHLLLVVLILGPVLMIGSTACSFLGRRSTPVIAPPTVSITSPIEGYTVREGEDLSIDSTSNDTQGVLKVELWVDGSLYRVDASWAPDGQTTFEASQPWHTSELGSHSIVVKAYSKSGQVAESTPLTVNVIAAAVTLPTATPTATATATAIPTDTPVPPTDTPVPPTPTHTSVPPTPTNTAVPGTPTDTPQPTGTPTPTDTSTATVTPTSTPDAPPVVEILSPADGTTVPQNSVLTVQVRATDDNGVARIELWADGAIHWQHEPGGTTPAEIDMTWQSGVLGDHILEAKAFDTAWQASPSVTLTVVVTGGVPSVPEPFAHVWTAVGGASGRLGNPVAEAVLNRWMADQVFQQGLTIWRNNESVPANYIYVLLYEGGTDQTQGTIWMQFEDLWQEGMPHFSCTEAEANGDLGPVRGFGKVWCEESDVHDGLKQPLAIEQGANGGFQDFEGGTMVWVARLGYVYVLDDAGGWQRFSD